MKEEMLLAYKVEQNNYLQTMQLNSSSDSCFVSAEYAYSNLNARQQQWLMFYIIMPTA